MAAFATSRAVGVVTEPAIDEAADGDSRAGSQFGRYRLIRLLGRGGFGEVYEAEDTSMDRVVALKLIADPYSRDPVFRERLFREARAAGRLQEPHVVPVHDFGEVDGQLYINMRLIDGTDLKTLLAGQGPLDPGRAVNIVGQIASALDAAHAAGMVHRDIKPANILLGGDDFAYLVDFGLASAATDTKLTTAGIAMGTFAYLAPERLTAAGSVSASADTYALACVLYECLTGDAPYSAAADLPALIAAHVVDAVPRPSLLRPELPASFDEVIARGMAKDAHARYLGAGELAAAAGAALSGQDHQAAPASAAPIAPPASAPGRPRPQPPTPRPGGSWRRIRRHRTALAASAAAVAVITLLTATTTLLNHQNNTIDRGYTDQIALPALPGFRAPSSIAVDTAYNVYVANPDKRVWRLTGTKTTQLPFAPLSSPRGLAVDPAGDIYVTDADDKNGHGRVLMLMVGSSNPSELPFTSLQSPAGIAVDAAGTVYVCDSHSSSILKLPAGASLPTELPFTGLQSPHGVAVDAAGAVYVTDTANSRVLKLPAGASLPTELPFTGLQSPHGVAVDAAGAVYVTDTSTNQVLKLAPDADGATELPFTGIRAPEAVAVDIAGAVYVADTGNKLVLKLPATTEK